MFGRELLLALPEQPREFAGGGVDQHREPFASFASVG
jgi:hypothetical protein